MEALLSSHSSFEVKKIKDRESLKIFQINAFDLLTNLSIPESHFRSNQIVKFKPKLNRKSYSETELILLVCARTRTGKVETEQACVFIIQTS